MLLPLLLAAAPQAVPTHAMTRRPDSVPEPVLDGVLDEELWDLCTPITDLRQVVPVAGAGPEHWTEEYFWDRCPWCRGERVHYGLDIIRPTGSEIHAAAAGLVIYTGRDPLPAGRGGEIIMIAGVDLRLHYYAHLSRYETTDGSWVWRGDTIGRVGNTGASDLPHLHYSMFTPFPHPHRVDWQAKFPWRRMFFLDPHVELTWRAEL